MKSNINLYADSKILIDKNLHIDSITEYLATLTKLSLTQLNYIVPKKEMKVEFRRRFAQELPKAVFLEYLRVFGVKAENQPHAKPVQRGKLDV